MFDFLTKTDLIDTLNNLIKIGIVSSVDYAKATARVSFADDDEIVSYDMQILHRNSLQNKDYNMPDIGEDVICIFLPSGTEEGFILGSVYAGATMPPEASEEYRTILYKDGTRISYNRNTHTLKAEIEGTILTADRTKVHVITTDIISESKTITATTETAEVTATTSAKLTTPVAEVNATTSATLTTPDAIVNATNSATLTTKIATVTAETSATVTSPNITLAGTVTITGDLVVTGTATAKEHIKAP